MSGATATIRRALLSCSALTRGALASLGAVFATASAEAAEPFVVLGGMSRQEWAVLASAGGILGFSILAAILLMRTRTRAAATEAQLRADLQASQADADRTRALLFAEPQVLVAWPAGSDRAHVSGDVAMLASPQAPLDPPQRLLAFGAWLLPEQAVRMERAVAALRQFGEGFSLQMATSAGRPIEAFGRAIGGQAVVRIRDLSGVRRDLAESLAREQRLMAEAATLRAFATALPCPLWVRRSDGTLDFANEAYAKAADVASSQQAVSENSDLIDSASRAEMARALAERGRFTARLPVVSHGERRMFDVFSLSFPHGSAGLAIDASEAATLRAALERMAEAHRRMLDQLSCAVAVFDGERRLAFYNDAYRRLWDFERAFLDSRPHDSDVLDRLRLARKIAEQPDFRVWKAKLHEAYRAIEPCSDTWYLPDGRTLRIVTTPNPEGGVTYLIDDVTESIKLARENDGLLRVQRETLDNLAEAVAVFGSNGRVELFNPPFAQMWNLATEALQLKPHISTVEDWCRPLYADEATWRALREAITGIENRAMPPRRLERADGTVLDCLTMPLPDGATMLTFQDVTDSVSVERVLRERNDALEAASQMKVDFVHHVSYELRSPLTTIIGFAHFLSDPATGPMTGKQAEYLGYITASTNALLAIINNILDLATIDAGAMTLTLGPVEVRKAIAEARAGVQDRLARERITLNVTVDPGIDRFVADEARVVQVLYNLLANAIGFAPEGSTVDLAAVRSTHSIVFRVTDRGSGMTPEVRDKAFDLFESHANGSRHRGAGLGLSLVRSFVELHGGHVYVDSEVGRGTTVTCEFPIDHAAQRSAAE
jgi:signal transduction histidine kinase